MLRSCGYRQMIRNINDQLDIPTIPSEIFRLASNNFDSNNFYIRVGSNLEKIIMGINFKKIQLITQTEVVILTLPFITFFQYLEKLTDKTALDSIHYRTEWKFALHLPISPPVMGNTILCEYRRFLLEDDKRVKEYQRLIHRLIALLPQGNDQHISAEQMLKCICELNQKDVAVSVLSEALTILKLNHPKWLTKHENPRLYARYLPATSLYDVLIPHDFSQFQLEDVLNDIDFLVKEVEFSGSAEIKNLKEIVTVSQLASQLRKIRSGKQNASDCDNFITILEWKEAYRK